MNTQTTQQGAQFFASGRWATERLKALISQGKNLSCAALRTLDTLQHDEWKFFDDAVVAEGAIRLAGVADLIGRGLVKNVPNALGKTMFQYERMTDMSAAITSLDGLSRSANDRQEFELDGIPLPITHKDFFLNLRVLAASRERGEALDTLQARTAARVCAEQLENMLFNGGSTWGGKTIYGYTTHPNRNTSGFGSNGDWGQAAKTGENILTDVQTMLGVLKGDRFYGPYWIYVPADAAVKLTGDFKAESDKTILQRLLEIPDILGIRVADQLATSNVVMVQATEDVTCWVQGEPLQTIQWDEYGGMQLNFKVMTIAAPLIRSDIADRSGVYHMTD